MALFGCMRGGRPTASLHEGLRTHCGLFSAVAACAGAAGHAATALPHTGASCGPLLLICRFAVAWYPLYRVPEAPLTARFLTFHTLASL